MALGYLESIVRVGWEPVSQHRGYLLQTSYFPFRGWVVGVRVSHAEWTQQCRGTLELSGAIFTRMEALPYFHTLYCSLVCPGLVVRGPVITEIMWYMPVIATISRKPAPCHLYHNSQVEQDHNQKYRGSSGSVPVVS